MVGLVCAECQGTSFAQNDEGFYVCLQCNTQSQDFRLEMGEDNELMGGVKRARKRFKKEGAEDSAPDEASQAELAARQRLLTRTFWRSFQCIIRQQVRHLSLA